MKAPEPRNQPTATSDATGTAGLQHLRLSEIRPNPYQPRKEFKLEELSELQASLKASGLLQPITVRPSPNGSGFELIAGERRFRAATALGWTEIPAVVRTIDDKTLLTLALIENLQRSDLNPLEEAEGYKRLVDEFALSHTQVGEVVGKDRSTVANLLRLLQLPAAVRRLLSDGAIALGHARALLGLGDERAMIDLAREAASQGLSVREVERRVQGTPGSKHAKKSATPAQRTTVSAEARSIEDRLRRHLQTDVGVHLSKGKNTKGELRIHFYSNDDLARVLDLVLGSDAVD
ncbi:MAG: ParB/RepB/Spo0J family partition protein [Gemmatimonadaceae bacterium]|nr:ParB/RepB/Spo0J family partition protein [Gemmatimonadaceae bacterium]